MITYDVASDGSAVKIDREAGRDDKLTALTAEEYKAILGTVDEPVEDVSGPVAEEVAPEAPKRGRKPKASA